MPRNISEASTGFTQLTPAVKSFVLSLFIFLGGSSLHDLSSYPIRWDGIMSLTLNTERSKMVVNFRNNLRLEEPSRTTRALHDRGIQRSTV